MAKRIKSEVKAEITRLLAFQSTAEISKMFGISQRAVFKIKQDYGVDRSPEQKSAIMSRIRQQLVQEERRRIIFGLQQQTKLKVVCNRSRHILKYSMKRKGYIQSDNENILFYDCKTKRSPSFEKRCEPLGIILIPLQ